MTLYKDLVDDDVMEKVGTCTTVDCNVDVDSAVCADKGCDEDFTVSTDLGFKDGLEKVSL